MAERHPLSATLLVSSLAVGGTRPPVDDVAVGDAQGEEDHAQDQHGQLELVKHGGTWGAVKLSFQVSINPSIVIPAQAGNQIM